MDCRIDPEELYQWCRIPTEQLEGHPEARVPIKITQTKDEVHQWVAQEMLDEVKRNNGAERPTRWILPCGPTGQYPRFTRMVNEEGISLRDLHVFHMDDFLDWQARPVPLDHPFSLKGWMLSHFYGPINPDLTVPEEQRNFPSVYELDAVSEAIERAGGVDTTWGGVGYRGHVAFNEPPSSAWHQVTLDEFRASQTRILPLNVDTIIAQSQRQVGGLTQIVPPMALTLGMKDLLSAGRIRIFSDTGAWKQTIVRIMLFGPVTPNYPVTLIQEHADALFVCDRETAAPPLRD